MGSRVEQLAMDYNLTGKLETFVDSFCDPRLPNSAFKNQLGSYTPCFTDVVLLGVFHVAAIILCTLRLVHLWRPTPGLSAARFRTCGKTRVAQLAAAVVAAACAVIVLFQVNGRVASRSVDGLTYGGIAPYESGVYAVSTISWALFAALYLTEAERYSPDGTTWLARFAVTAIAAAQIAKLRLVLQLAGHTSGYFFVLYIVYVALQLGLVLFAVVLWPRSGALVLREDLAAAYQVLPGAADADTRKCPESTSGVFSYLTFGWTSKLLTVGYARQLGTEDVWRIPDNERVGGLGEAFRRHWERELAAKEKPSLVLALWKTTMPLYLASAPCKLLNDAAIFSGPIFLSLMVASVDAGQPPALAYGYAVLMIVGLVIGTLADNHHYQLAMRGGYRMRGILVNAVFRKVLALTPTARSRFTSGFIFNLVTQDTEQLQLMTQNVMQLLSAPTRIVIAIVLLYIQLGPSALLAPAVFAVTMPINIYMGKLQGEYLSKSLEFTDERAKMEAELLSGIEVVKCSTWEGSFLARICEARRRELRDLWLSLVMSSISAGAFFLIPEVVAVLCFGTFVALGNELTASRAFTSLTLFTLLRVPLFSLPHLISQIINTMVGLERMREFLAAEEQPGLSLMAPAKEGETAVSISGSFTWDTSLPPSLTAVRLHVPRGHLVSIVGTTGSGKTTLLASLLGLTHRADDSSSTALAGRVAYVSQSAFLYNATVRDNILFGGADPPDEERYAEAIRVSSLTRDLTLLPAGDLTELGDRGVNVSGGQKQRISIARAYYANADIYLFDDPLSALDAKVGRAVFNNCVAGALQGCTRLLVTNQLQFVSAADTVVFLARGRVAEMGPYKQLMAAGAGFAQMMAQAEHGDDDEEEEEAPPAPTNLLMKAEGATMNPTIKKDEAAGQLVKKEARSEGSLSARTINSYVMAYGGYWVLFMVFLPVFAAEAAYMASTFWLADWTADVAAVDEAAELAGMTTPPPHPRDGFYLAVFAVISIAYGVLSGIAQFQQSYYSLKAADVLHYDMLVRLLRAPMRFFHTTPLGRTINRLTKDVSDVDKNLGEFAFYFCHNMVDFLGIVITIGIATPFALPVVVPVLFVFWIIYSYFQASAREVKRLDAVSRSPLYGTISEAINGMPTIRAYRAEPRLTDRNAELIDENLVMSHASNSLNRWLSTRLETLASLAAFGSAVLAIQQNNSGSQLGLTVSYALALAQILGWNVMNASTAENSFNSVDRIDEYCHIELEAAEEVPGSIPLGWPAKGKVEFRGVQMRYRPGLPLVLRGLSVTVQAGSKCGVVGRTGAGKSSLINCLFRLIELDGGKIMIDGVDIAKTGLKQLRSNLSLIPQVPVLFTGTLRENLDPFDEHDDPTLWTALRRAHLAGMVEASALGLDLLLSEGGQPLSAGQKQLVALARALLRHSKVLVLDEATANVDVETDALIQKTVRTEFAERTIIAVAHRLHTVIDTDAVLVMDAGQASEFGPPAELLAIPDGVFASMVQDTGEATAAFLHGVARGEISIEAHAEARIRQGALRAAADIVPPVSVSSRSEELAESARAAGEALSFCLAALREDAASAPARQSLGLSPRVLGTVDGDSAAETMAQALEVVSDIQALATRVRAVATGRRAAMDSSGRPALPLP